MWALMNLGTICTDLSRVHMDAEGQPNGVLGAKPPEKGRWPCWALFGPWEAAKLYFQAANKPSRSSFILTILRIEEASE